MPCLWSHGHPGPRLCGCCPGAGAGAGAGAGCAGRLSALSLCQPCPCPCLPLFQSSPGARLGCWRRRSGCSEDAQTFPPVMERQRHCPLLCNRCHAQGTRCCVQPQWGKRDRTWRSLGQATMQVCLSACVCVCVCRDLTAPLGNGTYTRS